MDNLIKHMQQHASVRDFKDKPLTDETKEQLLLAAQSGSSSNFAQAFSIIEIKDPTKRQALGELANCPTYVVKSGVFYVFIADLYRQSQILERNNESLAGLQSLESLLLSVVDTSIAGQNMALAAESLDLGICYIGGIRNDLAQVRSLLNLPKFTVPLFGMTIGYPQVVNPTKPRLPLKNRVAIDEYSATTFADVTTYDQTMHEYYTLRPTNRQLQNWTQKNVTMFKTVRRPEVANFVREQGFIL
ncbi:NADPH-dependent oxidoreductase [Bombilactobacillus thymidiniphilus]|uniref:NADPH-dependent oxidoreductase n=1 Tax=Bombilactobacillus thymidiniphilus TaxID=2923363 RepID=A0ABY4PFG1_9LACO|nr:NADPH-dependent oxidoreductase [Bombilactobacillus thymidiniphilus]UQS84347.1 NADPH-dependent oxidoreductase [Bombilactobacillus thymidiniphilus]